MVAVLAMRGDLNKNGCQKLMDRTPLAPESQDEEREISPPPTYGGRQREEKSILALIQIQNPWSLF